MDLYHEHRKKTDKLEAIIFNALPDAIPDFVAEKIRILGDTGIREYYQQYYSYLAKIARANGIAPIGDEAKELENAIIRTVPNLANEICEEKWNLYNEVTIDEFVGKHLKYLKKLAKREGIPFREF